MIIIKKFFQNSFIKKQGVVIFIVLIIIGLLMIRYAFTNQNSKHHPLSKITANIGIAEIKPMPLEIHLTGSIESVKSVTIRSQVTGTIKRIAFSAGQNVTAGQLLFEINPNSFQAMLKQAKANLEKSRAKLREDAANAERFGKLAKKGFVSQQQYDQAISTAAMQKATVAADQENVNQALIQLNYTKITVPIKGKTGNVTVREGDLVIANDTLIIVNQLDPVLANFNLPQNKLPQLILYQAKNPIIVEIWNETKNQFLGKGELAFIDNTVNPATGTILLKAKISNPKQLMWPGLMISVKLILTTEMKALVVPSEAVRVDQQGNFVYRVENNKAIIHRILVDRQINKWSVIKNGLSSGDQVITIASPDLKDMSEVQIADSNHSNNHYSS
jgi:membrane fusion protein, multidrug efflux system